jgi:TRAP-type transport system periplasmic protein
MKAQITRRMLMGASAALLATSALATTALAQDADAPLLGGVLRAGHPRGDDAAPRRGARDDFDLELHYGGTLFSQGTELVALQRGNLEMGNIAPQDIANQIPAWSILTSAYLFRDADHLPPSSRATRARR